MGTDTRARIVAAATEILRERPGGVPSVRAVAERAGVGASTLRHHFPSQRALLDEVLGVLYAAQDDDGLLADTSVPAADRLVRCLRTMLDPVGDADAARTLFREIFRVLSEPGADGVRGHTAAALRARARVVGWLRVLGEEGALPPGDDERRAAFLQVVVDGLAVGRAIPDAITGPDEEDRFLRAAVDAVMTQEWPVGSSTP